MHIGLTYDLRSDYLRAGYGAEQVAELDSQETIEALRGALAGLGHDVDPIGGVRSLVERLSRGDRWDLVFNICEGFRGIAREVQVPSLLEAYEIPCTFSDPLVLAMAQHKPTAKMLARSVGVPTPDWHEIRDRRDLAGVSLPFPLFVKPVGEGTSKGVDASSLVHTRDRLEYTVVDLLDRFAQPVMVETFLDGREFTVGVVGTGQESSIAGVLEVVDRAAPPTLIYGFAEKEQCEERIEYRDTTGALAERAGAIALTVWQSMGCRDAGRVDVRADAYGELHFLEVNPLAGLHPTHSDLPIMWSLRDRCYRDLIAAIVSSALRRVTVSRPAHTV